jgi:hypothetical protein
MDETLKKWVDAYEAEERQQQELDMSRSNPIDGARNPTTRWFEWAGGDDGGYVRWYDKEAEKNVKVDGPFTFLLLDELSAVKGWHEPSSSGIFSNEIRDTRQDVLVVRSFKGGELASGIYANIRDRIKVQGGHYCASIYLAVKIDNALQLANLNLKGAAAGAWMEFKRNAPTKKDAAGKMVRAYFVDAIKIASFQEAKKGATTYRIPVFAFVSASEETNKQAAALDAELQTFLAEYLKRPKAEAEKSPAAEPASPPRDERDPPTNVDFEDDIPF